MADPFRSIGTFLAELRRRKVYRVAAAYLIVAVGSLEIVDIVVPSTRLPDWSDEFFLALAMLGFPIVVYLAWVFDVTPAGLERSVSLPEDERQAGGQAAEQPDGTEMARATLDKEARSATPRPDRLTIAVLPFENLSGTEEAEPFAAGLHDDLLTELSRLSALTVISRTSVLGFRGGNKKIRQIAEELQAGTIIEGAVQKAGERVRLNIQMIDAVDDVHLWAERFDRELTAGNIFELQIELAGRITEALHARLTPAEVSRRTEQPTDDLEAYHLYSLGRKAMTLVSEKQMRLAEQYFEQAVARDPNFAPAWAEIGLVRIGLVEYGHVGAEEGLPPAEAASRRALALDPNLAEAHAAMGNLHCTTARREGPQAIRCLKRAIQLRPSYAGAHWWLGWANLLTGDAEAARGSCTRALQLNPLEPEARGNLAIAELGCGEAEVALREARHAMDFEVESDWARWAAAQALLVLNRNDEARALLANVSESWASGWFAGQQAINAGQESARVFAAAREAAGDPFHAGVVYLALGDLDAGFEACRQSVPMGWSETLYYRYVLPMMSPAVREDHRYSDVLRDVDRSWGVST